MLERWSRLESRAMRLCAAGFCVALLVASTLALTAQEASASYGTARADSDGYVPVTYSCFGGGAVGLYSWFFDGSQTYGKVTVNQCLLDSLGAGPQDFARVVAHEMGHARGLLHNSYASSVMSPVLYITGR